MKIFLIMALVCSIEFQAHAQLETKLMREIKAWHKGKEPPARLLKFPDGKIDTIPGCGLRTIGSEVGDYIWKIEDADLLAALMFDYRAQTDTFHSAASRLIKLKGVGHASRLLAERRKTEPSAFTRSELAVLSQLLRAPYITIQVARIAPDDMPPEKAEGALQAMQSDLQSGVSWTDGYRKHSNLSKDPRGVRTLVSFLYDSTVSPNGFDLLNYRTAETLPIQHLRELFRLKGGTHIFRAGDGVFLYHILAYYDDAG